MFIYVIILKQVVEIIVSTCFKIEKVEKYIKIPQHPFAFPSSFTTGIYYKSLKTNGVCWFKTIYHTR